MSRALLTLALLACPVGMGLMMWMMNRKNGASKTGLAEKQAELAALQAEVDQLRRPTARDGAVADPTPPSR